jgi:hypothetical protein
MRYLAPAALAIFVVTITSGTVLAQNAWQAGLPETTPCPQSIAAIATCYAAKHETGAYLLAAMPKDWNGDLIVFAHGGPDVAPPTSTRSLPDLDKYSVAVRRGFAWAASTYRRSGYGVHMAAQDSDDARKFFIARIAKPKRTILHGASYGGLVGAKLIETFAKNPDGSSNYDGAFLNSGAVAGATGNYDHRADLRVVYQYYCNNLPRPDEPQYPLWNGLPPDSRMTLNGLAAIIDECTGISHPAAARNDKQKQNLANILGVMGYPENLLFATCRRRRCCSRMSSRTPQADATRSPISG